MLNLIIVLMSIALLVGIVMAALFFMGDGYQGAQDQADFAHLQNEANQIATATHLYMSEHLGSSPDNVEQLVNEGYLQSRPTTLVDTIEDNRVNWEFGFDDFTTQLISGQEKCAAINYEAGGSGEVEDIPNCSQTFDDNNPCCTF